MAGVQRRDVQRAGRRILSEQRALGSAQNLDLLNVDEVACRDGGARIVNLIHIDAHALLQPVVGETIGGAQASNCQCGVSGVGRQNLQGRHELSQLHNTVDPGVGELGARRNLQGDRHDLRAHRSLAGGWRRNRR